MMQEIIDHIILAGVPILLTPFQKKELEGVLVDDVMRYSFFQAELNETRFVLLIPKNGETETPAICCRMSSRLEKAFSLPVVFYFEGLKYYERMRYIQKRIYFISSDENAYLPNLLLSAKPKGKKKAVKLSAAAQFLLFFHLQRKNLNGCSVSEIASYIPVYSYVSIAKAVEVLEDLKLCVTRKEDGKNKRITFPESGIALWEKVKEYLSNPIKEVRYCDNLPSGEIRYSGISALSQYSSLSSDDSQTVAVYSRDFKPEHFTGLNDYDGPVKIEIWRYPPIEPNSRHVDRLSLYITLKEDKDPRVEKETKIMFDEVWQTK